jgi:hypothetical protein
VYCALVPRMRPAATASSAARRTATIWGGQSCDPTVYLCNLGVGRWPDPCPPPMVAASLHTDFFRVLSFQGPLRPLDLL